jgi:hypothetical protein
MVPKIGGIAGGGTAQLLTAMLSHLPPALCSDSSSQNTQPEPGTCMARSGSAHEVRGAQRSKKWETKHHRVREAKRHQPNQGGMPGPRCVPALHEYSAEWSHARGPTSTIQVEFASSELLPHCMADAAYWESE